MRCDVDIQNMLNMPRRRSRQDSDNHISELYGVFIKGELPRRRKQKGRHLCRPANLFKSTRSDYLTEDRRPKTVNSPLGLPAHGSSPFSHNGILHPSQRHQEKRSQKHAQQHVDPDQRGIKCAEPEADEEGAEWPAKAVFHDSYERKMSDCCARDVLILTV